MQGGYGQSPLEIMAAEAMLQGLVYLDDFTYQAEWNGTLGSLGTTDVQIQINGDSDFVVQEINFIQWTNTTTPVATPNMLLTIIRSGSGREVMSQAVHVMNYCGNYWNNAQVGKRPMPGLIQAANNLTLRLQNLVAASAGRVHISLIGFKVFYTGIDMFPGRKQIFHIN